MINQNTSHDLFFSPTKISDFPSVLEEVQEHISQNYASLLLETDKDVAKEQIKFQIKKYLADKRLSADGMDEDELVDRLYTEMAEYSFLTKYIFSKGIEEININAWKGSFIKIRNAPTPAPIKAPTTGIKAVTPTSTPIIAAYGKRKINIPMAQRLPKITASIH